MRLTRRSVAHPCFATPRNGRCSCVCGCNCLLAKQEIEETGDWCLLCYGEKGHAPTRGGDSGPFRIIFDTDPTPPHGIARPQLTKEYQ